MTTKKQISDKKAVKTTDKTTKKKETAAKKTPAKSEKEKPAVKTTVPHNAMPKRRIVVNYKNLTPEVLELLNEKYPNGWRDSVVKIDKGNGNFFYAVMLDTDDTSYLIKVEVKVDTELTDDIEKEIFGDEAVPEDGEFIGNGDEEPADDSEDTTSSEE